MHLHLTNIDASTFVRTSVASEIHNRFGNEQSWFYKTDNDNCFQNDLFELNFFYNRVEKPCFGNIFFPFVVSSQHQFYFLLWLEGEYGRFEFKFGAKFINKQTRIF